MLPLKVEHRVRFKHEFRAEHEATTDWGQYLQREDRLALEAANAIARNSTSAGEFNRHTPGSPSNPDRIVPNWNRSYVLRPKVSRGAIVLLHGLSDSPYSMRATAELMHDMGLTAYVPRMPGHGFAVGDLRHARWEDWIAVVRIAMRAAAKDLGSGQPLLLSGYSNGALLALRHALDCHNDTQVPCPDGLLLLSPAIEVTPFARFADWHRWLSWSDYFEQFQWQSILPEVDPYKFTSFPKNPGHETHRAATAFAADLANGVVRLPPALIFQSVVDDTVGTTAVLELFRRLPANGSELILYDVNRYDRIVKLMMRQPLDLLQAIPRYLPLPGSVTVITNTSSNSLSVHAVHFSGRNEPPNTSTLEYAWPQQIFSLSHIALPFLPNDPVYGQNESRTNLNLGALAPKGEREVLSLSPNYFSRLRYNPFFAYQRLRMTQWLQRRWLNDDSDID